MLFLPLLLIKFFFERLSLKLEERDHTEYSAQLVPCDVKTWYRSLEDERHVKVRFEFVMSDLILSSMSWKIQRGPYQNPSDAVLDNDYHKTCNHTARKLARRQDRELRLR